jgi:hypothetical protein
MLASITPLGERGRQSHWGLTATAFMLGASVAGVSIGALAGALGAVLLPSHDATTWRLVAVAVAALLAIAVDKRPGRVPGPRRQVDERWLAEFRGWVYGLGYGVQLGAAVTTVISSAATYLALLAALLVASAGRGAIVMGCYGLVRGLSLLGGARVRSPAQLIALHARLDRARGGAARAGTLLLAAVFAGAVMGAVL